MQNILVPIDTSENANLAFQKGMKIAKRENAKLHLVNVIDVRTFQDISVLDKSIINKITERSKKLLEDYNQTAKNNSIDVDYSIEYGVPKNIIAHDMTKRWNINLIVIGATGLNTLEQTILGSVADYTSKAAPCDVLIIRKSK